MYEHARTPHHLHRPTRIWDAALKPRTPMRPDEPSDLLGELLECLFRPRARFRRLIQREPTWTAMPWPLWSLLAFIAIAGSLLYGGSLGLVLPAGNPAFEALAITVSAGAGWAVFAPVLLGITRRPAPQLAHACLVAMLCGEAVLELGIITNLLLAWLCPPTASTGLAINLAIVAISNLAMLAVLIAQLRLLKVHPFTIAALWLIILNPAALATFLRFYPSLLNQL